MSIKIRITRLVENPNYETLEEARERRVLIHGDFEMQRDNYKASKLIESSVLETEITETQFEAIRKSVLEVF